MRSPRDRQQLDPSALSVEDAARLLDVRESRIRADMEAGAPTDGDGRINLVHYAAWLNQQLQGRADG